MGQGEHARVPEEIKIRGGRYHLRSTVQQVRLNADSPYTVDVVDGRPQLRLDGIGLGDVEYPKLPEYYGVRLSDGAACGEIASSIGWGNKEYATNTFNRFVPSKAYPASPRIETDRLMQNVKLAKALQVPGVPDNPELFVDNSLIDKAAKEMGR